MRLHGYDMISPGLFTLSSDSQRISVKRHWKPHGYWRFLAPRYPRHPTDMRPLRPRELILQPRDPGLYPREVAVVLMPTERLHVD
jgi:hypothetical protein